MRRVALKRFTPLRPRSAKTARLYRIQRIPLVKKLLAERPWCEFPLGCTARSSCVHELLSRAQGGSILDIENLRVSCWPHNIWAEDHPQAAAAIGWKIMRKAAS